MQSADHGYGALQTGSGLQSCLKPPPQRHAGRQSRGSLTCMEGHPASSISILKSVPISNARMKMSVEEALVAQIDKIIAAAGLSERQPEAAQQLRLLASNAARYSDRSEPVRQILVRIGDKWSGIILLLLNISPLRQATIRRITNIIDEGDISPRMLSLCLRRLERDGFVSRRVMDASPIQVEYSLTEMGRDVANFVNDIGTWARVHEEQIRDAQIRFDNDHKDSPDYFG